MSYDYASQNVKSMITDARDFALVKGIIIRDPGAKSDNEAVQLPITLGPIHFPRNLYNSCLDAEQTVGKLLLAIANDSAFIEEILTPLTKADEFTRNLLDINRTVQKEGVAQPIISCIDRSDYMLDLYDTNKLRVRQVEVNAIASAMSGLSSGVGFLHKYLRNKYGLPYDDCNVPENGALDMVARGLIDAYDAYGRTGSYILTVIEDRTLNIADQISIELAVHSLRPDIRILRRRFIDLPDTTKLGPNKELLLEDNKEVAVVYYRYGYDPTNYNFSGAWNLRLLVERSRAIKCPSINFHLSGVKKFQQVLCDQIKLERFLSTDEAKQLAQLYCKFWTLDDCYDEHGNMKFQTFDNLVLKPQREGGGHNIFGHEIRPFLESITRSEERSQYILMEYINCPKQGNTLLKHDDDRGQDCASRVDELVSELGIYGSVLAYDRSILSQRKSGYLIRSKKLGVNEGGVAAGYAGISSLVLSDTT